MTLPMREELLELVARGMWHKAIETSRAENAYAPLEEQQLMSLTGDDWHQFLEEARAALAAEESGWRDGLEVAAEWHEERAATHAKDAVWMGPQRERYEGARISGVEMSPMNGPAIAYDREIANAVAIRGLAVDRDKMPPLPPAPAAKEESK